MSISGKFCLPCACLILGACAAGGGSHTDATVDTEEAVDLTVDDATGGCTSHAECDDGFDCTEDRCTVSGTCEHIPDDGECPSGQICSPVRGCIEGCEEDSDCDDGLWCNGDEHCYGTNCSPAVLPRDCNDGNDCTLDTCDEDRDTCIHDTYPECEVDAPPDITGDPFDPDVHYSGTFDIAPFPAQECPALTYEIRWITLADTGSSLSITAGPFTLTETPRPDGPDFNASGVHGCMTVTISGTFVNSDNFTGTWRNDLDGSCPMCSPQSMAIAGLRR